MFQKVLVCIYEPSFLSPAAGTSLGRFGSEFPIVDYSTSDNTPESVLFEADLPRSEAL